MKVGTLQTACSHRGAEPMKVGTLQTACSHRGAEPHEGGEIVGARKIIAWRHGGTAARRHGAWIEDQNVYQAYKGSNDGVRATGDSGGIGGRFVNIVGFLLIIFVRLESSGMVARRHGDAICQALHTQKTPRKNKEALKFTI